MEIILILVGALSVMIAIFASRFIDNSNPYPFTKKTALYSNVERSFLTLLENAVGNDFKIMTRVRLTDIIETKSGSTSRARRTALLRANAKSIDFVLCNKETLAVVAAVDLVNNASKEGHKAKGDWFVTGALESANIPHVRIKVKPGYKADDIRHCIFFKLGKKAAPKRQPIVKARTIRRPVAAMNDAQIKAAQGTELSVAS